MNSKKKLELETRHLGVRTAEAPQFCEVQKESIGTTAEIPCYMSAEITLPVMLMSVYNPDHTFRSEQCVRRTGGAGIPQAMVH